MKPLVECVPNFSEGRRLQVVDAIAGSIRAVPNIQILDVQSDVDHNRTVITFVGPPAAVEEAAFQGVKQASQLIDMEQHRGEHPRLGAADVVPFIPLHGVTVEECVAIARRVGRRVSEDLGIPVYLYEQAATRPDRVNLADIRRGEYEQLKLDIVSDPAREPDFGPAEVGSAGATVMGVRSFLIAFNAYLDTDNVQIARRIARAIRHSTGGYHYLKSIGILVGGRAQVSMNFTNFKRTPLHRVLETIRREAARYGARVTHTELIGLAPEDALFDAAQWHLQIDGFDPDQVLERRLRSLDEGPPWGFLDAVAAASPTPAGGSVSALAGALGAALVAMVARITVGKRSYVEVHEPFSDLILEAERLRAALTARVVEDAAAYEAVLRAYRRPRATEEEEAARHAAIQHAMQRAAEVPMATARDALAAMVLAQQVVGVGLLEAITDGTTAAWMAMASLQSAVFSVRSNLKRLEDEELIQEWEREIEDLTSRADALLAEIQEITVDRAQL